MYAIPVPVPAGTVPVNTASGDVINVTYLLFVIDFVILCTWFVLYLLGVGGGG